MPPALLDTNVLVHAVYRGSPLHELAAGLVDAGLRRSGLYAVAAQNLVEFAAVVTRPRFVDPPLDPGGAMRVVRVLYESRRLKKVYPQRGTVMRAAREGAVAGVTGPAWYDLFLATTMRDCGVRVVITENVSDFARIPFVVARSIGDATAS